MRNKRKYGLFFKSKDGRWIRLYPKIAYFKEQAVRIFQTRLLDLSLRGKEPALRSVKVVEPENSLAKLIDEIRFTGAGHARTEHLFATRIN